MAIYNPTPEQLGRRRFLDTKSFRSSLSASSSAILSQIQGLLPSNYPKDLSTTLNIHNRVFSREIARLNLSMQDINADKVYTQTRARYLQQVLGERLFLGKNIAPKNYSDESYRNYVTAIKSANLSGSKKATIEALASFFTNQVVRIKELYLEARNPYSSLGVTDTHKMIVQVFIDSLQAGQNIDDLRGNLDFFINLVRPAHVLYKTDLIWTETFDINKVHDLIFGDTGGGCVPAYVYDYFDNTVLMAQQVFIQNGPDGAMGQIDSIHHADLMFFLSDATRIITEPGLNGTQFFNANGKQVTFNDLIIGQYVRINYISIPGTFEFWNTPTSILTSANAQFYKDVFRLPLFQETVKKIMDPNGRFPLQIKTTPTTLCDRWVQDVLQPLYEDLRGNCASGYTYGTSTSEMLRKHHGFPELYWPYPANEIVDPVLLGSDFVQIMPNRPLVDSSNFPAMPSDITLTFDGTSTSGAISSVDSSSGRIYLNDTTTYWESAFGRYPINGDLFDFTYHYLKDGTNLDATTETIFGVSYWQLPKIPVVKNDGLGTLADASDVTVSVDGTTITNAIIGFDPLLGHVTLSPYTNYWYTSQLARLPIAEQVIDGTSIPGDVFKFTYYYGDHFSYALEFDDPSRYMDELEFLFDGSSSTAAMPANDPVTIGYRYRAFQLQHSSVLNSPGTFKLNDYQKPANRASIANQQGVLNHFNEVFSPEFLIDKNKPILDEGYLDDTSIDPVLVLNYGTPPFQKTFSYQEGLIYQKKLQDIRSNHSLLLYSDMVMREFESGDDSISLSSICDSKSIAFKIRYDPEFLSPISECKQWLLFDTAEVTTERVEIPGDLVGVPNLRVFNKNLRENFILRELEPTGTATFSYTFYTPMDSSIATEYQLPSYFRLFYNDDYVNFPTLPIVSTDSSSPVLNVDITCTVDGQPHMITALDATTGLVQIGPFNEITGIEKVFTLTQDNIDSGSVALPGIPDDPTQVTLTIIHGTAQFLYDDFKMVGHHLTWYYSELSDIFEVGDQIRVSYTVNPYIGVPITFTYHIIDSAYLNVIDRDFSRILDRDVFGGLCPDIEHVNIGLRLNEYYGFLDDYSDGIKIKFFNKDTLELEEHIFSGPIFETYDASEDEIGAPENFSNALIKVDNPLSIINPLNYSADYGYMNDALVRFRKKTYQELLPDRTFRTLKLVEMLPV